MHITEATFYVIDTETTGLDPAADRMVEFAAVTVLPTGREILTDMLINPGRNIPPEASAVHHLTDDDVRGAPMSHDAMVAGAARLDGIPVAHNAAFDNAFLPGACGGARWLCTRRVAMHLWPDAPRHSNQVLRYWLGLYVPEAKWLPAHSALADAWVTAALLQRELAEIAKIDDGPATVDELIDWADRPAILQACQFGKHRGTPWADVPRDYLRWILRQDFDTDTLHTARYYLTGA